MRRAAARVAAAICVERQHLDRGAHFGGDAGHAVDGRALAVLGDGMGAGLAQRQQAAGAVLAHAGEQHRDDAAGDRQRRAEQRIDRGPVAGHRLGR